MGQAAVPPEQRAGSPTVQRLSAFEYRYLTEFQSHEPEFDYLKSLEIEEKINQVGSTLSAIIRRVPGLFSGCAGTQCLSNLKQREIHVLGQAVRM